MKNNNKFYILFLDESDALKWYEFDTERDMIDFIIPQQHKASIKIILGEYYVSNNTLLEL